MASALFDGSPSRAAVLAALYYGLSSMGAQFMNKALFAYHGFDAPLLIALAQMSLLAPACALAAGIKKWCPSTARAAAPLAALNAAAAVTALAGTGALSVPLFITLRRFTAAASMAADRVALGKAPPRQAVAASGVMAAGAALAALTEAKSRSLAWGCAAVLANAALTAWYLARIKQQRAGPSSNPASLAASNPHPSAASASAPDAAAAPAAAPAASLGPLSAAGLLFYTSALAVPPLAACTLFSGEAFRAWKFFFFSFGEEAFRERGGKATRSSPTSSSTSPHAVALSLAASALLGGCVHHATYVASSRAAGPEGPSLAAKAGALKNVLMTLVGAVAFGDYAFSWLNALGHAASTAGALWFAAGAAERARAKVGQQATPLVRRDPTGRVPLIGRDRLGRLKREREAQQERAKAAAAAAAAAGGVEEGNKDVSESAPLLLPRSPEQQAASTTTARGSPSPLRATAAAVVGGAAAEDDSSSPNNNKGGSGGSNATPPRGDDSRV